MKQRTPPGGTTKVRCVIVDDNAAVLRAAGDRLAREGLAVVGVASDGEMAIRLVAERKPDVTIVDIDLGERSGLDLARRLHELGTRTILTSTHDADDFADLIAASPALGFLAKPELSAAAIRRLVADDKGTG